MMTIINYVDALERLNGVSKEKDIASSSRLGEIWPRLIVRVMSARNHDFGNAVANSFYNQSVSAAAIEPTVLLWNYVIAIVCRCAIWPLLSMPSTLYWRRTGRARCIPNSRMP